VRTDFGRCAIVRFLLAAAAAFLMFFLAALRCFIEAICSSIDLGVGRSLDAGGPQLGYSQINGSLYLGEHVAKPSAGPGFLHSEKPGASKSDAVILLNTSDSSHFPGCEPPDRGEGRRLDYARIGFHGQGVVIYTTLWRWAAQSYQPGCRRKQGLTHPGNGRVAPLPGLSTAWKCG
jgi:hypothetical protein